ncbi:D-inositol 3-phosphate glycosyltransferase [compost metagenome]
MLDITRDIELTYNFVDERVYYPRDTKSCRSEFAAPGEKVLMHISNFRPVKRVGDVVDIFNMVNAEVPSQLLFVGEGPDLPKIQWKVKELGITDRVHFLGKQDDIAHVISMADVLLLPSEKESFGLVALEAMACGIPTIGSLAGGIPELVAHGETGFLAPIGDTRQMADDTLALLRDEELALRMREECLARATGEFSSELITARYESIYYKVLGRKMPMLKPLCG